MDDDDFFIPGPRQPQHERGNSGSRYGQPQHERGHSGPRYGHPQRERGHSGFLHRQPQREEGHSGPRYGQLQRERGHSGPQYGQLQRERSDSGSRYGHPQRERGHSGFLHGQPQREEGHSGPRYGQLQRERGHSGPQYGQLQRERSDSGSRYGQLQRERGYSGSRYGQLQRERGHSGPQNRQPQSDKGEISQASRPLHLSNNQRGKSNNHEHSTRHVGFLYLKNIANSADTDIIQNVNKQYEALFELLKSPVDRPDVFVLVMKIAHKVAGSTFDRLKIKFLLDLCNSQFIVYLRTYLMDLPYMSDEEKRANQMYWQKPEEFWESLVAFCECVINTVPSIAKSKCRSLIEDTSKLCLEKLSEIHKYALPIELSSKLNDLREAMKIVEEKMTVQINSKKTVALDQEDPPDNFRELSVLPTKDDLLVQKPFIRPNIIDGAYRDVEHYLDVQFRLLREDCFGPLRDGIYQYIKEPTKRRYDNIRVYQNVTFLRPYISNNKIGTVVQVDQRTTKNFKNIKWHYSQRLKFGTLLLLSKDNCKSFTSMTVMDREEHYLNKGQIPVEILDLNIGDEIYDGETYTMIESEVYFEPYQHVLRALQDPQFPNQLAMKKYIVDVDIQPSRPKYLEYIKEYKIYKNEEIEDIIFQPNHDIWPSKDDLGLNESQLEAYKVALTHEFAVIQGPPGTGKTHIGVEIAKTLLWNVSDIHLKKRFKCRMLLVCYTNHALDQFLEALLPYTKSIARIGGQSKNKALDDYNLSALRKEHRSCGFSDLRNEVNSTMSQLASLQNTISDACNGVLKIQVLEDALGSDVADKLEEYNKLYGTLEKSRRFTYGDPMGLWLFENVNIDYYELIDKRDIINEIHAYIGILNYKEDEDKKKKENEKETSFCFSVDEACKTILELVSIYETEIVLQEKVILQRKIATLRGQIRLFTEMRDLYDRERRTNNRHDMNFSNLSVYDRWMLYFRWVDDFKEKQNHKMIDIKKTVSTLLKTYEEARLVQDCEVLSNVEIIGMTTSGAARLRKMIQNIGPPIVIVEEAAEVLEQHIITSLTKDCQHLILIGDHKQLRPSAAHMRLARQFNIEVSLFERMILNSVHSRRLCVQHRMRPEFARLLAPHIYPDLQNHPSVEHFPDVRGITTNLFFFTHDHKEVAEADSASKSNPKEADMILLLANYIMQQGYGADDVTILAAYSGQMFYMRKERINYPHLDRIKITLVDNYQGEESKIILLSLVRNNDDNRIGFLGTENRICVALSRAREGFYIFGNMNLLKTNSTLWSTIDKVLNEGDYVGTSLPLRCENHKNETNMISSAEDFQKVPEGGCLLRCDYKLVCGHQCALLCHSYGRDHKDIKCQMDCERKCEKDHPCPLKCRDPCRCQVRVIKKLPCGHENEVFCYEVPELVHCSTVLDVTLPLCGHQTKKQCWVDIKRIRCTVPCDHRLDLCGHACIRNCHVNHDPLHEKYECRKPCARANKECSNQSEEVPEDHLCKKLCYEPCDYCHVKVLKKRSTCAHRETVVCSQDVDKEPCKKKCTRMLPCGHYCKKLCSELCGDCDQMVEKVIAECQHTVKIKCKLEPTRAMCTAKCERSLSCGHTCKLACRDACDADKCTAPAAAVFRAPCGHDVQPPCALARKFTPGGDDDLLLQYCTVACSEPLQCGHACAGDCSSCHQGRLHMPCAQPCGRQNFCGHICDEPCSKICPPCRKPCEVRCMHSKCTQLCGAPCSSCKENCGRACAHGRCTKLCNQACTRAPCTQRCERRLACGHACRGYCGEPCPDVCKLCRPDQFPTDFLGDEFEDDAIFVVLEDCGHVLHSEDMENLMNGDQETIGVRKCPFCRRAIITTQRYKETINYMFKTNINPIKMKIYGNKTDIAQLREELLKNLTESFAKIRFKLLPEFLKDPIEKLYRLLISKVKYNKRCDNPQIQMYRIILNAIDLLFEYCQDYNKKRARTSVVRTQFDNTMEKQVKMLSIYLAKNVDLFSVQQQEDYQNELKRVPAMINLSQAFDDPIFADVRNNSYVAKAEKEAKSAILGCNIYDHEAGTRALKALQETTKIHYDPAKERAMIVKAMDLKPGHWFKCPNGHYYCITECGGAMEVGRCLECKESIGGQNHRLLSTNRHAGEMDGSRFARYSEEANNMANFD